MTTTTKKQEDELRPGEISSLRGLFGGISVCINIDITSHVRKHINIVWECEWSDTVSGRGNKQGTSFWQKQCKYCPDILTVGAIGRFVSFVHFERNLGCSNRSFEPRREGTSSS